MLSALFTQWVEGLSATYLFAEKRLRRRNHYRLRGNSSTIHLLRLRDSAEEPVFSTNAQAFDGLPKGLLSETRNSTIEILVPARAIVEQRLDPLPAESLPFID